MSEKRILISIGCDSYSHMNNLCGAEKDARDIFDVLTNPDFGNYSPQLSKLLLSPTSSETLQCLTKALTDLVSDTLTIFFAGHGVVTRGSYYLCLSDSNQTMLSTTALGLPQLFAIINEVAPSQCNLIIDACQAGGLVSDIGTLLKPELIGNANTPGIALFASSAADEYSGDTPEGGVGTTYLLKVLRGDVPVQAQRPFLDLVEIGQVTSGLVSHSGANQTPVVWGLNLFGQSRFTKNPHHEGAEPASLYQLTTIPPDSPAGMAIRQSAESIWSLYYSKPSELTPNLLYQILGPVVDRLVGNEEAAAKFVQGLASTFLVRVRDPLNSFVAVEVLATCISLLLPFCGNARVAEDVIAELADQLLHELELDCQDLQALLQDKNLLHSNGLSDLFYLPLRLMRVLGWLGSGLVIGSILQKTTVSRRDGIRRLIGELLSIYAPSLIAMSDEQTPFALTFLHAAYKEGWSDQGEMVLSSMFCSLHVCKGNIATPSIDPSRVLEYLSLRARGEFGAEYDLIGHPAELLSALLFMGAAYALEDAIDPYLSDLDHLSFNIFLPEDHRQFLRPVIRKGRNHTFQIGHGVWSVNDFVNRWFVSCAPQIDLDRHISSPSVKVAALCASLVLPNRSPWFLLQDTVYKTLAEVIPKA